MIEPWRKMIWAAAGAPTLMLSGVRKIMADMSLSIQWEDLVKRDLRFEDLCYTKAKGTQLRRNYWNQASVDAAFEKLGGRTTKDHTSVSIQMQGAEKHERSQGFCMQNTVITMTPDHCSMDIYYRSTELVQKFAADLVFFSEQFPPYFEALGRKPDVIRFRFANMYLSAMFMPIFLRYEPQPLEFFEHLKAHDQRFYRTCGLTTRRFFMPTHNYTYRTRIKMFDYFKRHVAQDTKPMVKLGKQLMALKGDIQPTDDEGDE